ncbi:MAG: type II toxin-antitoxin system RelE/ParE family toxin [Chloroflexota bacterium]|nr:type II toxin-antitoxin system RelE/ParE family toxin [Chloroflexota bacterium]
MKTGFRSSFVKDLKRVRSKSLKTRLKKKIEAIEYKGALQDVSGIKKLQGSEQYYRIRIGDYRIGLMLDDNTVIFVRFLHRKDIYRYFP